MAILSVGYRASSASPFQKGTPPRRNTLRKAPAPLESMLPGMSGDFARNAISPNTSPSASSPTLLRTPLSRQVHASSKKMPGVAHVHKLPLRDFQETERGDIGTPLQSGRRRSASLSSLGTSSCGETARPRSGAGTTDWTAAHLAELASSPESSRPLSRIEVQQRNQDAVDWFRSSQAINSFSRPCEETEAMLAAARERRSRPPAVQRCTKVEKVDDLDVESVNGEDAAPAPAPAPIDEPPAPRRSRRILDPMLLWGAKPVAAKVQPAKTEAAKKVPHGICNEGVKVGESHFLARLRKRASTFE